MKRYLLSILVLLTSFTCLDAQSLLRRAEIAYQERNYNTAVDAYEKYYAKKGEMTPEVSIPLANSYYHLSDYANAQKYYDKTRDRYMSAQEWLNYGEMLRKQGLYAEAKTKYGLAKKSRIKNVPIGRINLGIKACEWAEANENIASDEKAVLSPSGFDTKGQSFGLQFYEKGIVYSSTGSDTSKKKNLDANGKPILNLAYGTAATDSTPAKTEGFSKTLLFNNHVGSAEFSANGKTIYYTKLIKVKDGVKLKIFSAQLNTDIGDWVREEELPFCSDEYNFAHPALSLDGRTLYFSSDMEGTIGGMDIFKVRKKGESWGKPTNLGVIVNTEATEIFPYVTPGGYLSFSSNGHPGLGGLDAFWVEMENGNPVAINNASRPINSSYDDFAAVIDPNDTLSAYVSTNRATEGVYDEIYEVELTEDYVSELRGINVDSIRQAAYEDSLMQAQLEEAALDSIAYADSMALAAALVAEQQQQADDITAMQGAAFVVANPNLLYQDDEMGVVTTFLVDALSFQLLKNASFEITDNISKEVVLSGVSDDSANVILDLKVAEILKDQALTVKAIVDYGDFSSYTYELVSDRMKAFDEDHPIMLTPIMSKRDRVKENIIADEEVTGGAPYTFDGYDLTAEGRGYLDAWADFLVKNPTVKIKLMTHTDGRGDVAYNFKLSQRRAFVAKRYLISQGVNHMQVIARGYGERYPLIDCTECTEKEHDANRRIEMEVINK